MQTHSSVSVNMTGLVQNVYIDYVVQLKKYHVTLFLYLDWN